MPDQSFDYKAFLVIDQVLKHRPSSGLSLRQPEEPGAPHIFIGLSTFLSPSGILHVHVHKFPDFIGLLACNIFPCRKA